jgi:hypothetical protein
LSFTWHHLLVNISFSGWITTQTNLFEKSEISTSKNVTKLRFNLFAHLCIILNINMIQPDLIQLNINKLNVQCTHTYDFLIREYFHFRIVQHYLPCQWGSLRHCHLGGCRLNIRCTYLHTNKSIWRQPLLQRGCFIVLTEAQQRFVQLENKMKTKNIILSEQTNAAKTTTLCLCNNSKN